MGTLAASFPFIDSDKLLRVGIGKRAQQHRIDDGENGSGRADAQRQSQNSDHSESRILRQRSCSEAEVLPEIIHVLPPPVDSCGHTPAVQKTAGEKSPAKSLARRFACARAWSLPRCARRTNESSDPPRPRSADRASPCKW